MKTKSKNTKRIEFENKTYNYSSNIIPLEFAKTKKHYRIIEINGKKFILNINNDVIYKTDNQFSGGGSIENMKTINKYKYTIEYKDVNGRIQYKGFDKMQDAVKFEMQNRSSSIGKSYADKKLKGVFHFERFTEIEKEKLGINKEEDKYYSNGGSIETPRIKELKAEIKEFEEVLEGTTDKDEREVIEEGLSNLKKELKELESKPQTAPIKVEKKEKLAKTFKKAQKKATTPKQETSFKAAEGVKHQKIGKSHELIKVSETAYLLKHANKKHADFEINKKDKKWQVFCITKEEKTFNTLSDAVEYVSKKIYKDELKEFMTERKAKAKKSKERVEKRKEQGKPVELTATEVATKETKKVIEKIDEKHDAGKNVSKDVNGVLKQFVNGIRELKSYKKEIDKKLIRQLIGILKSLID
jgi:hypothetical protein